MLENNKYLKKYTLVFIKMNNEDSQHWFRVDVHCVFATIFREKIDREIPLKNEQEIEKKEVVKKNPQIIVLTFDISLSED